MEAAVLRCLDTLGSGSHARLDTLGSGSHFDGRQLFRQARSRGRRESPPTGNPEPGLGAQDSGQRGRGARGLGKEWRFGSEDRTHRSVIGVRVLKEFLAEVRVLALQYAYLRNAFLKYAYLRNS